MTSLLTLPQSKPNAQLIQPALLLLVGGINRCRNRSTNAWKMKVPVVVTDGDLLNSNRLSYVGTNWYNLGVIMAEYQIAEHEKRGLNIWSGSYLIPDFIPEHAGSPRRH